MTFLCLPGCSVEKEAPVTIFEGAVVNDETGEPVEGVTASIYFQGCYGLVMGCVTGYSFSTDEEGKFSFTMPYGEYEKEKDISRYVLTVILRDSSGGTVFHELVSCGKYGNCSSFLAGKKYTFEYRYKLL